MEKDDIRINRGIIHILDSTMAAPVLSDMPFDTGSDFCDFLKGHIYKLISGDDLKTCHFNEGESQVYQALLDYSEENFVPISKMLAGILFDIMNENIDIPQADFLVIEYRVEGRNYLALLKMNYKISYTHRTKSEEIGKYSEKEEMGDGSKASKGISVKGQLKELRNAKPENRVEKMLPEAAVKNQKGKGCKKDPER